ncbi:response regulator [Dactylosporangium sp. CS-033363]|uniref:response regulator n=1 Tax=Dactylosporangium sp. CS-033363 TaxID=3239935 RepID=UPI003D8B28B8
MISILIADDHPMVREGLQAVFAATDDITVLGEAVDGAEAVALTASLRPRVVLMDLQMPGLHGIEATRRIAADHPGTAVLVLTMFEHDDMVFAAVAAGAVGYLLKGAGGADIVTAVRAAGAGQAVFGAALALRLRTFFAAPPPPERAAFPQLTARERVILNGIAAGLTNAQIAQQEYLSVKTVANNVSTILAKLHLTERGQAIVAAREAGLGRRPRD